MLEDEDRVYVTPGEIIAEKYRVERILGVGGMGFVVAATHVQLEGTFALKFLKKRFLADAAVVDRFTREAQAACRIRSDYVARVFDVGTTHGAPFLVMDYLVGRDLAAVLAEHGRLAVEDAVEYTVQACAALAAAHACGVVHRDIKPENLFLVESDGGSTVKLLDFGISRVALTGLSGESGSIRHTGALTLGTPLYMSPEQIRSTASATAQSDLWSVGVVLYELLAGTSPFLADSINGVCAAILEQDPAPLLQYRPDAPVGLAEVIERCLKKDPAERYRNVSELAVALLGFAPARALSVAEGSASIRRAAIQALGVGVDPTGRARSTSLSAINLRVTGNSAPTSASSFAVPAPASATFASAVGLPVSPPTPTPPSRRRVWAVSAAALAVLALVAALGLRRGSSAEPTVVAHAEQASHADSRTPAAVDSTETNAGARPAALAKSPVALPPVDDGAQALAPAEARPSRGAPAQAQVRPTVRWTPASRSAPATPSRAPAAPSTGSVTANPDVAAPSSALAPPVAPGRPDLGY